MEDKVRKRTNNNFHQDFFDRKIGLQITVAGLGWGSAIFCI